MGLDNELSILSLMRNKHLLIFFLNLSKVLSKNISQRVIKSVLKRKLKRQVFRKALGWCPLKAIRFSVSLQREFHRRQMVMLRQISQIV